MVIKDRKTRAVYAHVVPAKGNNPHAVNKLSQALGELGHKKMILKSDQEPAILELKELVKIEREDDIVLEESPVKESQSNGEVERAIQEVQGQVRTTKAALESRYENRITEDHPCLPWLVAHSADTLRRFQVHKDGKTAYQRVRGKVFRREVMEFGECVWYYKPGIKGKSKLEPRYENGVWLGMTDRSGET